MLRVQSRALGPFATNAYLLSCPRTRHAAVLDVGFEPERVLEWIARDRLEVRLLLNTHAHYDHIAAMREMEEATGAAYWLHPADRFLVEGLSTQGAAFGLPPARPPATIHDLFEGQTLDIGDERLEVIHTPGHSPGGVTFRSESRLWVGDLLFAGSIGRTDLPGGSLEELVDSVRRKLFPLGDECVVYPGHGPETTLGEERRTNPFVGDGVALA